MTKGSKGQCSVEGCMREHKARGYCCVHYQQAKRGLPLVAEIVTRARYAEGDPCSVEDCSEPVKSLGLCRKHYARFKRHGHTEQTRVRGACSIDGCEELTVAKGLCRKHYYRNLRTGSTDDPEPLGPLVARRCMVGNCQNIVVAREMCQTHYMRWQRHGDVLPTRAADWGSREKHPLYSTWNYLVRFRSLDICDRWGDLWAFVEDLGDSRPSMNHTLARRDDDLPLGPDNFYWVAPRVSGNTAEKKKAAADNSRQWRIANLDKAIDGELRKKYGIGLAEYAEMLEAQNGACDICHQPETRVDHRTKKVSRLAVDHDHKTGVVRALLCHGCNNALGAFGDDQDRIKAALAYLERHRQG